MNISDVRSEKRNYLFSISDKSYLPRKHNVHTDNKTTSIKHVTNETVQVKMLLLVIHKTIIKFHNE